MYIQCSSGETKRSWPLLPRAVLSYYQLLSICPIPSVSLSLCLLSTCYIPIPPSFLSSTLACIFGGLPLLPSCQDLEHAHSSSQWVSGRDSDSRFLQTLWLMELQSLGQVTLLVCSKTRDYLCEPQKEDDHIFSINWCDHLALLIQKAEIQGILELGKQLSQ